MRAQARPVVVLTNPIDPPAAAHLAEVVDLRMLSALDADTIRRETADAEGLIVRAQLPADLFVHAPRLRAVVRHGAGLDMIPMAEATAHRVMVANCPGTNADSVAEYVVAQMLALARGLPEIIQRTRSGDWPGARALADAAFELRGATLGIVGVGAIGRALARIASAGLGMRVLGFQRHLERIAAPVEAAPTLAALLAASDVVALACPLNESTRGLIDAAGLARMKPTAWLINVSRGAVIDQPALIAALRERRIAGAALDVFTDQPLAAGHPLLMLDNVLPTPHLAGITAQSMRRMSALAVEQLLQMLAGGVPPHLVNPEVLQRGAPR